MFFLPPMKNKLLTFVLAALCSVPWAPSLQAQYNQGAAAPGVIPPGSMAIKAINVSTPETPEFATLANQTQSKRYTLGKWLEVEVEFASAVPAREATFHYNILIANTLLVGDVTHVNILPGQSLFSVMYVAPRALQSVLRGQPLTQSTVQNIDVQILRPGVGAPLSDKMLRAGPAFYNTMQQVTGMVLNKNQTPFAFLWWDRYEPIKPGAAASP
jgi:hypothetical protein